MLKIVKLQRHELSQEDGMIRTVHVIVLRVHHLHLDHLIDVYVQPVKFETTLNVKLLRMIRKVEEPVIHSGGLILLGLYIVQDQLRVQLLMKHVKLMPELDGHVILIILVEVEFQCVNVQGAIHVRDVMPNEDVLQHMMEMSVLHILYRVLPNECRVSHIR